jgi:23S rRNA pseudouridine1911/1915/1917 synthase
MLHAEHLVFAHPKTGKELDLRAPLPADFEAQLGQLRKVVKADARVQRSVASALARKKSTPPAYHVHESRK